MNLMNSLAEQVGVTDEVTTCFCCQRKDLARTVVFRSKEEWRANGGDEFIFLGTTCATKVGLAIHSKVKINARGQGQTDQDVEIDRARIRVGYARLMVGLGYSLADAWETVRHLEQRPNGLAKMAAQLAK